MSMISAEDSLNCKHQCGDVINRFKSKGIYDGQNAKVEFRIICSEESQISLAIVSTSKPSFSALIFIYFTVTLTVILHYENANV